MFDGLFSFTSLNNDEQRDIGSGLLAFEDCRTWIEWGLRNRMPQGLHEAFRWGWGDYRQFNTLVKKIAAEGSAPAKTSSPKRAPDAIDALKKLAGPGGGDTVYAFRRLKTKTKTVNQIGGRPPGVPAKDWPMLDDDGMVHLFTLDLDTMPLLQQQLGGVRTYSLFVANPDSNEAYEPYNGEVAVLLCQSAQLGEESEAPEDTPVRDAQSFEVISVDVATDVWTDTENKVRKGIYGLGARALGEPLWLQSEEHFGQFVMQFDESFADMSLGDSGIMYCFMDTAFWQCH